MTDVINKEWYENKDLYEMMVELSKGLENTNLELAKTQVLISKYNGLRERIDLCEQNIANVIGRKIGSKEMWGYIVGGFGVLITVITLASK